MENSETETVDIDAELLENIQRRVELTHFETVDEYIETILIEVIEYAGKTSSEPIEDVEDDEVQKRLESLGYLE